MSKFFKTLSGEMYKTFRYPFTYICVALLVAALIASCFTFKSQNEVASRFTLNGQTKDEVYTSFTTQEGMNKTVADTQIEEAHNKIATITTQGESTLSTIKALVGENSTANNEGGALWYYKNNFTTALSTISINELKSSRETIINKLSQAKDELTNAVKSDNITILITESIYKNFVNDLENCVKVFQASSKSSDEIKTYQDIAKEINDSNILEKLKNYTIKDMTKIELTEDSVENLNNLYTKAKAFQAKILSTGETQKNNSSVSVKTYKNTLTNYFYVSKQYATLVENSILYDNVLNLSDVAVRKYKGYKDETVYNLRETITKNTYLIENDKTELNFATPFKAGLLSSDENVFDFMYYGLTFCSIILLIFAIGLITRQIAGEFADGSFKVLLTHSSHRHKVLSAKILSTLLISILFMILTALVLFIIGAINYGIESTTILAIFNGNTAFETSPFTLLIMFMGLEIVKILFFILVATTISIIFRNKWVSGSISFALLILTVIAPLILTNSIIFAYTPLAGVDMFQFFGNGLLVGNENALMSMLDGYMYLNSNFYVSLVSVSVTALICIILSYSLLHSRELK